MKDINIVFPDRRLYLFDTFEGFSDKDIKVENENNFSESFKKDFSATNIKMVLKKMKYPKNCIIKKGYFPDTAQEIDEKFVFVNIDVDLYLPIYNGLEYFYPRLQKGGYIFVHDYNTILFKGVKEAVKKYAKENDLSYFPLSDHPGTVVFIK
jgi:O-methyltransferase